LGLGDVSRKEPSWGEESRFFLPNEDAGMVREAIQLLEREPVSPVFVGGSGLLVAEVARSLPERSRTTFVDISSFQVEYFREFLEALEASGSPEQLRGWFSRAIYARLRSHFLETRNSIYSEDQVFRAMESIFQVRFFFEPGPFHQAKRAMESVEVVHDDIANYLESGVRGHDFIYLSNVLDYIRPARLDSLLGRCQLAGASVYALLTEACGDREAVSGAVDRAGYTLHPESADLSARNRGLGSRTLDRPWNRKGEIMVLIPGSGRREELL
jgi:hypothetical protein